MDLLTHLRFTGPALPEPFVRFELERELAQRKLLPKSTGAEGERVQQAWEVYRRTLRELVAQGGAVRVRNRVLEPLASRLGYTSLEPAPDVATREGLETGGALFVDGDGRRLRAWSTAQAYGLDRAQYAHVLSTFSHKSYPQAPALCLARFDELTEIGLDAFTKKWDPYWDVPLNESLPEAVIELQVVGVGGDEQQLRLTL